MKKVLVICPYPENVAPSQRLKFEQYYPAFRQAGYEIQTSSFINYAFWNIIYKKGNLLQKVYYTLLGYFKRIRYLFRLRQFDIVYIHLWVTPFGPPIFEWLYRNLARKIVYDIDDLVYLNNKKSSKNPIALMIKGKKKPIYLIKNSEHIITCTPYLDQFVRKFNSATTDISSTVDTDKYQVVNTYSNAKPLTIGWSGSISTSRYFYLLENMLKKLRREFNFKILVIGNKEINIKGLDIEAVDWSEETEMDYLKRLDIGLYPLPNEDWVYGKSGLKAIQYMALGLPTVATALGANFRVIENGVSGFLVSTEDEWIECLSKLIRDQNLRRHIGTNARLRVENLFSVESNKKYYIDIFNSLT
ncbi:MAG TPA: glycosyltransferase family 4 protein [Chitinophagaceae bacterium]|jgi:glycosyltransferase involved in cell wall biosynthesis|nr:glycosyltransferase family 4 protein [Chitinophagaceae bacterium]